MSVVDHKPDPSPRPARKGLAIGLVALFLVSLLAAGWLAQSAVGKVLLDEFTSTLRGFGVWGMVGFAVLFIISALLLLPGAPLVFAAGLVYGTWQAFAIVTVAATLAAGAAFLMARHVGGPWMTHYAKGGRRVRALLDAAQEQGFVIVILARLSPLIPFSALNVLMGVSGMRLRTFLTASFVGKAPSLFATVYLAEVAASTRCAESANDCAPNTIADALFVVGIAATLYGTWQVARTTRRHLKRHAPRP